MANGSDPPKRDLPRYARTVVDITMTVVAVCFMIIVGTATVALVRWLL